MAASALRLPAVPQDSMLDHPPPAEKIELPEAGTTLPMGDISGRPIVEARVNGKGPYRFIVDTGASITVVDSDLRTELGLPAPPGGSTAAPEENISGTVRIAELQIGDAALRGVVAAVAPIGRMFQGGNVPRGVLSATSFAGCLLILDYPAKQIAIREGGLPPADARGIFQYTEEQILPNACADRGYRCACSRGHRLAGRCDSAYKIHEGTAARIGTGPEGSCQGAGRGIYNLDGGVEGRHRTGTVSVGPAERRVQRRKSDSWADCGQYRVSGTQALRGDLGLQESAGQV